MNADKISPVILGIETADGIFLAHYSEHGLSALDFPNGKKNSNDSIPSPLIRKWHALTTRAVKSVLKGGDCGPLPPLDLSHGTDFQKKVWAKLLKISAGKTETYSQIASSVGKPKSARAVGGACGANPIPVLIPCHRVVAANKRLGGFSGGLDWKKKLLAREGSAALSLLQGGEGA